MPATLNSEVVKKRALVTYAILKGMTIDVGRIINAEIYAMVYAKTKTQSIECFSLILELFNLAKVILYSNPSNVVAHFPTLMFATFITSFTPKTTKRQKGEGSSRSVEEEDNEEDKEAHNGQEVRLIRLEAQVKELR